ncbi:hypothetical protein LTR37_012129 [Vermiconidia calcicola]|uniref:Uncharacterized protein n=1 Tax=Vermiconidia calcicola TaxID=1690605 RepID=A0ACC3N0K0_9PEZI|nr:hypothetical protein LTR37_012129 [Vermiconidia calcicola]
MLLEPYRPHNVKQAATKKTSKKVKSSSSPAPKRQRDSSPEDLVNSDLDDLAPPSPKRKPKKRPDRTPSTSPPPAPPEVEYMREGYDADDIYRMVEDEFYITAKKFTQHIHHAEYARLKRLAKSRGAGTLKSISRGTDGRTEQSTELKLRLEAEAKAKKQKAGLKGMDSDDESSGNEDDYMNDPQLAGLMTGEELTGRDLTGLAKAKSNTRAAAGFDQSPRNVERFRDAFADGSKGPAEATSNKRGQPFSNEVYSSDEDDDEDLDTAPPVKQARPANVQTQERLTAPSNRGELKSRTTNGTTARATGISKQFAKAPQNDLHDELVGFKRRDRDSLGPNRKQPFTVLPSSRSNGEIKDNTFSTTSSSSAQHFLAERDADKERKQREAQRKAQNADDVRQASHGDETVKQGSHFTSPANSAKDFLAQRRAAKVTKEREKKRKARGADEIPTFMF